MTGGFSGLGFGMAFTLKDAFSGAAAKIDKSMEQLTGRSKALSGVVGALGSQWSNFTAQFGAAFAIGASVSLAAQMSDTLADVADATGLSTAELEGLRTELEAISTRRPLSEQLELATVGHQLGIAKEGLKDFVAMADMVGVSLQQDFGSAAEAATQLSRLGTAFTDTRNMAPTEAMGNIANALDAMADNARVSAQDVSQFALKLAQSANVSSGAAIGLGTAFLEMGLKAKPAAAAIGQVAAKAIDAKKVAAFGSFLGVATGEINRMANAQPDKLFMAIAERLATVPAEQQGNKLAKLGIKGGQTALILKQLSKNTELVRKRMDLATESVGSMDGITGAFNAKNATLAGVIDRLVRSFTNLWTRVGEVIGGALSPFMNIVESIISTVTALIANPVVGTVLKWGVAFIAGAAALIGISKAIGFVRTAFTFLSIAARGALVSLAPFLIIAAPIIGLVVLIQKAQEAFANMGDTVQTGFGGFLQRLGGIVATIREVWSSWDSVNQEFTLSQGLLDSLDRLGIRELALSVATWVVRIKEFLSGVIDGFTQVFNDIFSIISSVLTPIQNMFDSIGFSMMRNVTATEKWRKGGKILGGVIMTLLTGMALKLTIIAIKSAIAFGGMLVSFGLMIIKLGIIAIQSVLAFLPMLVVIGLIGLAVYAVIKVFGWLWGYLKVVWEWIKPLVKLGMQIVENILAGIKAVWGKLVSWITAAIEKVPLLGWAMNPSGMQFKGAINAKIMEQAKAGKKFTEDEVGSLQGGFGLSAATIDELRKMGAITETPAGAAGVTTTTALTPKTTVNVPKHEQQKMPDIVIEMDKEKVGTIITRHQNEQLSRE